VALIHNWDLLATYLVFIVFFSKPCAVATDRDIHLDRGIVMNSVISEVALRRRVGLKRASGPCPGASTRRHDCLR
jgi:hypothetical protein